MHAIQYVPGLDLPGALAAYGVTLSRLRQGNKHNVRLPPSLWLSIAEGAAGSSTDRQDHMGINSCASVLRFPDGMAYTSNMRATMCGQA